MEHNFVKDEGGTDYQIMDLETNHHSTNLFVLFYHYVGALNRYFFVPTIWNGF